MERQIDIHKAGAVLLEGRKLLVTRTKGKDFFIAPGGKVESGETTPQALARELREELGVQITESDLEEFGTFYSPATGDEDKYLQMDVFLVPKWEGEITPASEIEEIQWINATLPAGMKLGSIFQHNVLPKLKERNLIG